MAGVAVAFHALLYRKDNTYTEVGFGADELTTSFFATDLVLMIWVSI